MRRCIPEITLHHDDRVVAAILRTLSCLDDLDLAVEFLDGADMRQCSAGSLGFSPLLGACEGRNYLSLEVDLLQRLAKASSVQGPLLNSAVIRLLQNGQKARALALLESEAFDGHWNEASLALWHWACADHEGIPLPRHELAPTRVLVQGAPYEKELRLMAHVFTVAQPGDAASVCDSMEDFGLTDIVPGGEWLKLAAGSKTKVLTSAARESSPQGVTVEFGTYCGYSAMRLFTARPDQKIITVEVDPVHVAISRSLIALAGLSDFIEVWTGHSDDVIPRLARVCSVEGIGFVFMDQRGSRYHANLAALERLRLLRPGSVIVADNVLKPGAPAFLWHVLFGGSYDSRVVSLREFGMPEVEDWVSISNYRGEPSDVPPRMPSSVYRLDFQANHIRDRATTPGHGVDFQEWALFASKMKAELRRLGISATECDD